MDLRRTVLAVLVSLTATSACGGTDELTSQERRQADERWEARFGSGVEHGSREPFSLSADSRDDTVYVTVRAHEGGVAFSSSSLGAELVGYRDGEWRVAGDPGVSLPAERVLRRGDTVQVPVEVSEDAQRYRALVRSDLGIAWVDVSHK
jgi:hypothetical protein